jgi:two-component system, LytTR family, sensor kinase
MNTNYPIKKLSILNLWMTSFFFLFGIVTMMATNPEKGDLYKSIFNSVLGAIILLLNSFLNLVLLLLLEKRSPANKSKHTKKYISLSYVVSFFVFLLVIIVSSRINTISISLSTFLYIVVICIFVNTLILAFQNYIITLDAKLYSDIENSLLKAANADAANQLLRQQIHPHLLFNALNILKSLYKVNPKRGEEFLIHLSDFLRAAVSNNNIKVVSLKDELKLCDDYLMMLKIRFGTALLWTVSVSEEKIKNGFVPSFSIQPLLENAIKHNELTDESPLHILISQEEDRIRVTNNSKLKLNTETPTGSGLTNLSERYRILSGDELIIEDKKETFSVSIKILEHESSNH